MKKWMLLCLLFYSAYSFAQTIDAWKITANTIDPGNYYGVTVANGMISPASQLLNP